MSDLLELINRRLYLYPPLEADTLKVLGEFLLLWNLYEAKFFDTKYTNKALNYKIDKGEISLTDAETPFNYFIDRYLTGDDGKKIIYIEDKIIAVDDVINRLQLRNNDYPDVFRSILLHNEVSVWSEKTFAVLLIIYRLRNNLFHGIKQTAILNMQKENFQVAIGVLTDILWQKRFLY